MKTLIQRSTFKPHSSKSTSMADTGGESVMMISANRTFQPQIRVGPTSESPPFGRRGPNSFRGDACLEGSQSRLDSLIIHGEIDL
jgi:hypothetical protein